VSNRQGWSKAYNFNLDEDITITQAMKLRRGKDPRAGDLHCHRDCFFAGTGDRLLTRKEAYDGSRKAHFAKWPSESVNPRVNTTSCSRFSHASSRRETMDYAQYYSQFEEYLDGLIDQGTPFFISSVERGDNDREPDFTLTHTDNEWSISRTSVTIIDENKRRKKRIEAINKSGLIDERHINIIIVISEYTIDQLDDFERGGIEKFEKFWKNSIDRIEKELIRIKNYQKFLENREAEKQRLINQREQEIEIEMPNIQERIDKINFTKILPAELTTLLNKLKTEIGKIEQAQDNNRVTPKLFKKLIEVSSDLRKAYESKRNQVKIWRQVSERNWEGLDFFESRFDLPEDFEFIFGEDLAPKLGIRHRRRWVQYHGSKVFIASTINETIDLSNWLICRLWEDDAGLANFKNDFRYSQKFNFKQPEYVAKFTVNQTKGIRHARSVTKQDMIAFCRSRNLLVSGTKSEIESRIYDHEKSNWNELDSESAYLLRFLYSLSAQRPDEIVLHCSRS